MKKRIFNTLLLFLLVLVSQVQGQDQTFDNVLSVNLRNSGEIIQANEIKGYYFFFKADKVGKGSYSYRLVMTDPNLKEVGTQKMVASRTLYLLEASYNGAALCFKFYDSKEKKLYLYFYDNNAEKIGKKTITPERQELAYYAAAMQKGEIANTSIFAVPGKGFLHYRSIKNKKMGYNVQYYPNNSEEDDWKFKSDDESRQVEFASFILANDDLVLNSIIRKKSLLTKDMSFFIQGIDPKTGDEIFDIPLEDEKHSVQMMNAFRDKQTGNVRLFGYYFDKDQKEAKGNSLGMCQVTINNEGEVLDKTLVSWEKDIAKFLPTNERGKMKGIGYLYFHRVIQTDDGKVFAIGEQYSKEVSGGATALNVLAAASGGGSNVSNFKMVVRDFFFLEFDKDFTLQNVKIFEKGKSNVALPAGAGYYGAQFLANFIKAYDGFDYEYSQIFRGGSVYTIGYLDFERLKGEKNKWIFGTISYADDEYTVDKINLDTDASSVRVMPAKPGYVLMSEYYKKEKRLDLHLEKVNY